MGGSVCTKEFLYGGMGLYGRRDSRISNVGTKPHANHLKEGQKEIHIRNPLDVLNIIIILQRCLKKGADCLQLLCLPIW